MIKEYGPVKAVQWTGDNTDEVIEFCPRAVDDIACLLVPTVHGYLVADKGDYITKDKDGKYYPYDRYAFKELYDKTEDYGWFLSD